VEAAVPNAHVQERAGCPARGAIPQPGTLCSAGAGQGAEAGCWASTVEGVG